MSTIGSLEVLLTATDQGLVSGLRNAEQSVTNFVKTISTSDFSLTKFGVMTAAVGAGLIGLSAAIGGATIKAASDFEQMITSTGNNAGMTADEIARMRQEVLNLSAATGASKDQLAQAYMFIHDMGFAGEDAATILQAATKEGLATNTSIADTASVLATAMHSFKIPVQDAAKTLDMLHTSSASARMTMQDFMTSFGPVGAQAAAIGVPMNEVAAAMAALTRSGFDASMSAVQVRDMLLHIMAPAKAAKGEIQQLSKSTGVDLVKDFSQAGLQSKGFIGVLNDIKTATGGNAEEMNKLIPNLRGGLGALVLVGKGHQDLIDILAKENSSVGSTEKAYSMYSKTTAAQSAVMKQEINNLEIAIGTALLPKVNKLLTAILPVVQGFAVWANQNPGLVAAILATVAVAGVLLVAVGGITAIIGLGIPGAIALAIAAIVGLAIAVATNFSNIRNWVTKNIDDIIVLFGPAGILTAGFIDFIVKFVGGIQKGKDAFTSFRDAIKGLVSDILGFFGTLAKQATSLLSYINPLAHHSPSLVEQVASGVSQIKASYQSLSQMQMPALSAVPVGGGGSGSYNNTNNSRTSNINLQNTFNVRGEANASNIAEYLAFQISHKGL